MHIYLEVLPQKTYQVLLQEALKCLFELKKCTFTYLNQTLHKHFWHFSKHSQTYPSVFSRVICRFPPELYRQCQVCNHVMNHINVFPFHFSSEGMDFVMWSFMWRNVMGQGLLDDDILVCPAYLKGSLVQGTQPSIGF